MVDANTQIDEISADRLSLPVCRFRIESNDPIISGTNTAFEEHLQGDQQGTAVRTVFEELFAVSGEWGFYRTALTDGEQFRVQRSNGDGTPASYLVEVIPPEDGEDGILLFNEITDVLGEAPPDETGSSDDDGDGTEDWLAVDHVASVVSHDLRNPLDVARARLRAGRDLDEDEHFDHVEKAHDRMERIIQDVLTLARGEDVVDPDERVDLGVVAEEAWETVETNGAELTVENELPTALADPDRVSRLFENFFRNAVEHAQSDGGSVHVTVGRLEENGTDGFYVADDGPGISEDHREDIFKPGYTSDDHGTGLGLAIVARIADIHGWSVDVTESAEQGARFNIRGVS